MQPSQTVRLKSFREWIAPVLLRIGSVELTRIAKGIWKVFGIELAVGPLRKPEPETASSVWLNEYKKFRKNLKTFCQRIGSPFDDLATPESNILRLKQYASQGKQKMEPLYKDLKNLREELDKYKRINTMLLIRQTIEKLVGAIESKDSERYKKNAPGERWKYLWEDVFNDYCERN